MKLKMDNSGNFAVGVLEFKKNIWTSTEFWQVKANTSSNECNADLIICFPILSDIVTIS